MRLKEIQGFVDRHLSLLTAAAIVITVLIGFLVIGGVFESCRNKRFDKNMNQRFEQHNTQMNKIEQKDEKINEAQKNTNQALDAANAARHANLSNVSNDEYQKAKCAAYPTAAGCPR